MDIKALREKFGLSQSDLSELTGIPKGRIGSWEYKNLKPKRDDREKLESVFAKLEEKFSDIEGLENRMKNFENFINLVSDDAITVEYLQELREINNLSQADFGQLIGYTDTYVRGIEKGRTEITKKYLKCIEKVGMLGTIKFPAKDEATKNDNTSITTIGNELSQPLAAEHNKQYGKNNSEFYELKDELLKIQVSLNRLLMRSDLDTEALKVALLENQNMMHLISDKLSALENKIDNVSCAMSRNALKAKDKN